MTKRAIAINSQGIIFAGTSTGGIFRSIETTTLVEENIAEVNNIYSLAQNYPNPFNPLTSIEFTLPRSEYVELKVYNILGADVATLISDKMTQGKYTYQFDGSGLASGVYFYRIETGDFHDVKKMTIIK